MKEIEALILIMSRSERGEERGGGGMNGKSNLKQMERCEMERQGGGGGQWSTEDNTEIWI